MVEALVIVNQAGYPVYYDSRNEHVWSAATQVGPVARAFAVYMYTCTYVF
jgi:hypothetical protein|eukprot:COSAG01_NODE_1231_length_11111_cov_37.001816_11_plen_50_part_00